MHEGVFDFNRLRGRAWREIDLSIVGNDGVAGSRASCSKSGKRFAFNGTETKVKGYARMPSETLKGVNSWGNDARAQGASREFHSVIPHPSYLQTRDTSRTQGGRRSTILVNFYLLSL